MLEFEWDREKARRNEIKHGISFEEAKAVFVDIYRVEFFDIRFDYDEERTITIGMSASGVLHVVNTERHERIRIISARPATRKEAYAYAQARGRS